MSTEEHLDNRRSGHHKHGAWDEDFAPAEKSKQPASEKKKDIVRVPLKKASPKYALEPNLGLSAATGGVCICLCFGARPFLRRMQCFPHRAGLDVGGLGGYLGGIDDLLQPIQFHELAEQEQGSKARGRRFGLWRGTPAEQDSRPGGALQAHAS